MQILQLIFLNAYVTKKDLSALVILRMVKLTLQYGLSGFSSIAFTFFGMICMGVNADVDVGFRFGRLGLVLLERFEAMEYLPRVYAMFYGIMYPRKKPIRGCLEPLLYANRIGLQTGDLEFSCICANIYCFNAMDAGMPLDVIDRKWRNFQDVMHSKKQESFIELSMPNLQAIHHLMGLSDDPLSPRGDLID